MRLIPLSDDECALSIDFVMPAGSAASPAALAFADRLTGSH